jgi:hypothetical protein
MENYIIKNSGDSVTTWKLVDSFYLSILPPQKRSVLVSKSGGKDKLIRIDFPELAFIYYQLTNDNNGTARYVPKLTVLNFVDKKDDILSSIVTPIIAPNCYSDTGEVCLGDLLLSNFKIDNLLKFTTDKFFNASFNYWNDTPEKNAFRFDNLAYKAELREFIPCDMPQFSTLVKNPARL